MLRDRQVRLLTLTGAPGTGKTRLALGLCHAVVDNFPDGVWFVPLAGLERPDLVVTTIAQHLGIHQVGRRPLIEAFRRVLEGQRLLLVLDNFEHLLPAASHVVELLEACAGTTVLATSRAPLRVSGEHRFRVPPLEVPNLDALPGLKLLSQVAAVHLFVQRARAIRPEFSLTEHNASAVAELTVRLDGLPLAIELAAARSAILDPWQLLSRLGGRLALLTDGPRDLPDRHRTLRAAIRWSYDLLTQPEQRVFRRLAVFAGACTLDAAEFVVGQIDGAADGALESITSLCEQSLLQQLQLADGALRVVMSETIREYALAELTASGEHESVREQHARYYGGFAQRIANPQLDYPDGPALMLAADRDHDNLRSALRWYVERGDADASLRLASALWSFWEKRGHWAEGLQWLQNALALPGNTDLSARSEALIGMAILHRERSEFVAAATAATEAMSVRRALGNLLGVTRPDGTRIAYQLDGQNRRVGKSVNGNLVQAFLFQDGLRPVAELDAAGNILSRFVYSTDSNVPDYFIKNGTAYRIITDQVGSVRLVVDSTTGQIVQRLDYDEFGNVLGDSNPGFQPFGFAGGLYDRDTGLVHFGAREYDPTTGRWTTPDPVRFNGGDTNLYAYVQNDPVDAVDPLGLDATCAEHYNHATRQWEVEITLNIAYGGFGFDPALVNAWNDAISQTWTGTFGGYDVVTTIGSSSDNYLVWIWPGTGRAATTQGFRWSLAPRPRLGRRHHGRYQQGSLSGRHRRHPVHLRLHDRALTPFGFRAVWGDRRPPCHASKPSAMRYVVGRRTMNRVSPGVDSTEVSP
jgi:RHS repeat-associated protein